MNRRSTLPEPLSSSLLPGQSWATCIAMLIFAVMLSACSSLIAPYNETSYRYATSLKPEAMRLMKRATEDYSEHAAEAEALMLKVEQAYEYVAGLPKNDESAGQWKLLKNPDGNLLGGFIKRWQEEGKLSKAFVNNVREDLVGPAFDAIIALESLKIKE